MNNSKVMYQIKDKAIWLVLIVLVIAFTVANPRFINPDNLLTLLRQVAFYGIASVGMMFVILLGDIDLSVGTIMSFINIIGAYMMVNMGMNMYLACALSMVAATLEYRPSLQRLRRKRPLTDWPISYAAVCRSAVSRMALQLWARDMLESCRFQLSLWQSALQLDLLS